MCTYTSYVCTSTNVLVLFINPEIINLKMPIKKPKLKIYSRPASHIVYYTKNGKKKYVSKSFRNKSSAVSFVKAKKKTGLVK